MASLFSRIIVKMVAITAILALICKNSGRVAAFSTASRLSFSTNKLSTRNFNSRGSVLLMSSQEGGDIADAGAVINPGKKEKKEKKEKVPGEKKVKAVAPVQGIEEIREVRVQKVATMREAGNRSQRHLLPFSFFIFLLLCCLSLSVN